MLLFTVLFYFSLPFQVALSPASGIDLAGARIFALGLGALWLANGLRERKLRLASGWQLPLLVTFVFLAAFSLFGSERPAWGWRKLVFILSFLPLFLIACDLARDRKRLLALASAVVYGAGAAASVGILQFLLQFVFPIDGLLRFWTSVLLPVFLGPAFSEAVSRYPSLLVNVGGHTLLRATAFFPDPHMFSFFVGMAAPLALGLAQSRPDKKKLFSVLAALIFLGDLLSFSRGGYLGLAGGSAVLAMAMGGRIPTLRWKRWAAMLSLPFAAFLLLPGNPVVGRFASSFSLQEGSNQGRIAMWKEAARVIGEHPLQGVGLGNYPLEVKPSAEYREPIYAHNLYLDIAAETGLINAAAFLLLLAASCYTLFKRSEKDPFFIWPAVSLTVFAFHALVETPLYSVHILPLLLLLLAFAVKDTAVSG
jgi:O-antigen ligase